MLNGDNVLNIDSLKNAIDVTYIDANNQEVSCKVVPQRIDQTPVPPGVPPVYSLGAVVYDVTNRQTITIPVAAIRKFGPGVTDMTERDKDACPPDSVVFATVMLTFTLPVEYYKSLARSLTKELHWAKKKLEFFRGLGHAGYATLESEFDEVWQDLAEKDESDGPVMTEEEVWDQAVERMMKQED